MILKVNRVDVWASGIEDEPGGLARKLATLAEAGANLEFIVSRRTPERPIKGVVFLTPIVGDAQLQAAEKAKFRKTPSLHSVRVEGVDWPGVSAQITEALASAGISLQGVSAAVIGKRFVMYLALDTIADAEKATHILLELS